MDNIREAQDSGHLSAEEALRSIEYALAAKRLGHPCAGRLARHAYACATHGSRNEYRTDFVSVQLLDRLLREFPELRGE